MRGLAFGVVELTVLHAATGAHSLHITGQNALDIAHAVFVRQLAAEHVADDFHVLVAVRTKTPSGSNAVFIDNPQIAEAHVGRIVVTGKRKRVKRLEPTVVGITALSRPSDCDHEMLLSSCVAMLPM